MTLGLEALHYPASTVQPPSRFNEQYVVERQQPTIGTAPQPPRSDINTTFHGSLFLLSWLWPAGSRSRGRNLRSLSPLILTCPPCARLESRVISSPVRRSLPRTIRRNWPDSASSAVSTARSRITSTGEGSAGGHLSRYVGVSNQISTFLTSSRKNG